MARTIDDAILQARQILQDISSPHRYPDSELVSYLNSALGEIRRVRPDVFFPYTTPAPFYSDTSLGMSTEFPLEDIYFQPVVYFIAGTAELRDDEFAVDSRAATLLRKFETSLLGVMM